MSLQHRIALRLRLVALRDEAIAYRDLRTARLCDLALAGSTSALAYLRVRA